MLSSSRARVAFAICLVLGLTTLWATTFGADTARRLVANSLREQFAPDHLRERRSPTPVHGRGSPPGAPVTDLGNAHFDALDTGASNSVSEPTGGNDSAPTALTPTPVVARPASLRDTSFVLLLGMDNRSDKLTGRADTIIIAAFRHRDGKVAAFSVPRDLWVELPGLGPARINSTVRIGNHKLGKGRGIPLMREVIAREFGIRIDHYAAVDLAAFVQVVDAVGGIDVDLPCPIMDCFLVEDRAAPCEMLDLAAGSQRLDGETALRYARSRHGRGDRDRTRRQQLVVVGLANKIRARGLRGLPSLWKSAEAHVDTDLDFDAAVYFASFALESDLRQVGGFAITKPLVERHITQDNKHVLLLHTEAFNGALGELFDTRLPALRPRKSCPDADIALQPRPKRARRLRPTG